MVNLRAKKSGFSLAEALVSMLVVSLFFLATSKIITVKPKPEVENTKHGYFECFYDQSGALKQKRSDETHAGTVVDAPGGVCSYEPPAGVAFANIYILNDGKFYNATEPLFDGDSSGSREIHINGADISTFQDDFEDTGDGNDKISELKNFFESCHKTSAIYAILKENQNYQGPALFIGW